MIGPIGKKNKDDDKPDKKTKKTHLKRETRRVPKPGAAQKEKESENEKEDQDKPNKSDAKPEDQLQVQQQAQPQPHPSKQPQPAGEVAATAAAAASGAAPAAALSSFMQQFQEHSKKLTAKVNEVAIPPDFMFPPVNPKSLVYARYNLKESDISPAKIDEFTLPADWTPPKMGGAESVTTIHQLFQQLSGI